MYMKDLGSKLKRIRQERGFPQKLIAEHLGLQRPNYSKTESNLQKLTPEQITLFCEFCDISADYLLGVESKREKVITVKDKNDILQKLEEIRVILNE